MHLVAHTFESHVRASARGKAAKACAPARGEKGCSVELVLVGANVLEDVEHTVDAAAIVGRLGEGGLGLVAVPHGDGGGEEGAREDGSERE